MTHLITKREHRNQRHSRLRTQISGTANKPRISVFKSNRHVFIQVIDDEARRTIVSSKVVAAAKTKIKGTKTEKATKIGEMIAEKMKEKGITQAVFDRGGFKYHGRVKAVAEGIRQGGIKI